MTESIALPTTATSRVSWRTKLNKKENRITSRPHHVPRISQLSWRHTRRKSTTLARGISIPTDRRGSPFQIIQSRTISRYIPMQPAIVRTATQHIIRMGLGGKYFFNLSAILPGVGIADCGFSVTEAGRTSGLIDLSRKQHGWVVIIFLPRSPVTRIIGEAVLDEVLSMLLRTYF